MSGFANQIIGGLSKLIRPAIQSPNYAPSSAGWTINQDGSAEFNNATFRGTVLLDSATEALLVYSGEPALGNLILAISAHSGIDKYGNAFNAGLTISTGESGGEYLTFYDSAIQKPIGGVVGGAYTSPNPGVFFEDQRGNVLIGAMNNPNPALNTPYLQLWDAINNFKLQLGTLTNGVGLQIGAGLTGKYYFEQVETGDGQSIPTNTSTTIKIQSLTRLYSDYGGKFSGITDEWTCPVSSLYLIGAFVEYSTVPSGITRNGIYIQQSDDGGATWRNINYNETGANVSSCNTPPIYIPQGSLIRFQAWHNGTTAGTLDSNCFASAMRFL